MSRLIFFFSLLSIFLISCGDKKYDWNVYEGERTLFYSHISDPINIVSELKIVSDKTELEMLQLQAEFAEKSNDETLYFLIYEKRSK